MTRSILLALALLHGLAPAQAAAPRRQAPPAVFDTRQQPAPRRPAPAPQGAPAPAASPAQEEAGDDVVRVTSNLVQFDAVVVDGRGRQVGDLAPEEFEVTLGGERQEITNFSYVSAAAPAAAAAPVPAPRRAADRTAPPVPPARLRAGDVRRTVALVVDDLNTSFEGIANARQALRKFVDEQMQPRDLVAIIRTSAGMGALQQFTTDKRLLHKAIERVRWYPRGSVGLGAFAPIQISPEALADQQLAAVDRETGKTLKAGPDRGTGPDAAPRMEGLRSDKTFAVGTLGALNYIIRGMEELPGRKSILMFSEGFEFFNADAGLPEADARVIEEMRRVTTYANRAAVVIYTLDARGLPVLGLTAEDNTANLSSTEVNRMLRRRQNFLSNTQAPLFFLARETGGFVVRNRNDLSAGVGNILEDQSGYYLIGFRPPEKTFERARGAARFHELKVKVRRAGLSVRTRSGFFGITDAEAARPAHRTRVEQLFGALASPVAAGDVGLRLTSVFNADAREGPFVSSLMHIDMGRFEFEEEADGWRKAVIDLFAVTVGEGGQVVDQVNRTETVRVRGEMIESVVEDGLVYVLTVPVRKPGAYQLRVAVRDAASERLGSASQFIEVPDLKKNRLALSGLVMEGSGYAAATADASVKADASGVGRPDAPDPQGSPAVRRFRPGALVDYHLNVYNARQEGAGGRPRLSTQMRLFRDGRLVFAGRATPLEAGQPHGAGASRVQVSSRFRLGTDLAPGEYVLQVVVTDALADPKHATAAAWTDFEIVR